VCLAAIAVLAIAAAIALSRGNDPAPEQAAAPAARCRDEAQPYGEPPGGFIYEPADEATRARTMQALGLDDAGGRVDMQLAKQGPLTLGSIVGVPSDDPDAYASEVVARAAAGDVEVQRGTGFALIPLGSGSAVAVGVRGCRAVMISAQDPKAVQFLAALVLGG
jgi:hypothetical protein